jgi:hypothetical protein
MKTILLATLITAVMASSICAQQRTPPTPPPGMKTEQVEAEILKVYSMEDQGAKFRAYVVKYKGNEVIVSDDMAMTNKQVGDKIKLMVIRHEASAGTLKINTLKFDVAGFGLSQK